MRALLKRPATGTSPVVVLFLLCAEAQAATFTVTNENVSGAGSLRQAMLDANATAGPDLINFAIPGGGVHVISPTVADPLPVITEAVTIDGTTQAGYNPTGNRTIAIDGSAAGAGAIALDVAAGGATITGLNIRFYGTAIRLQGPGSVVSGNYIGTSATGGLARPNGVGIVIRSAGNLIDGTTAAGQQVISGNTGDGIQIDSGAADNNVVIGNYIGVTRPGNAALGNGGAGVAVLNSADNNRIGGTAAGQGNVISANANGIVIAGNATTLTLVQGNLIGTNAGGAGMLGNTGRGILIDQGATDSTIGGTAAGAGNTIANSGTNGIGVDGGATLNNVFLGNRIYASGGLGIDLELDGVSPNDVIDGDNGANQIKNFPVLSAALTNGAGSLTVAGSMHSVPGRNYRVEIFANTAAEPSGFGEGQRYLGFVNVTTNGSGDAAFGLRLAATVALGEYVTATATDLVSNDTSEFSAALQAIGTLVVTTTADILDGTTTSIANLIANPGADGRISLREAILAANATAGTDTIRFGIPLADSGHLYYPDDAAAGSVSTVQATGFADVASLSSPTISGFDPDYPAGTARSFYRIQLTSALPAITGTVTFDTASQPLSLASAGPIIEVNGGGFGIFDLQPGSSASTIRGFVLGNGNFYGVRIQGSSNNVVAGNFFGTNVAGIGTGAPNFIAVYVGGSAAAANDNRIGGTTAADRNVISSSTIDGIEITGGAGGAARTLVQGNYIGTDVTGTRDLGNTNQGIAVFGTLNTQTAIGGTAAGAGNVISGNNGYGILIANAGTSGTLVRGNRIGTDAAGAAAIANGVGIRLDAGSVANNTIGGIAAGAGNVIANSVEDGVRLTTTAGIRNSILGNAIYANGGLGIDLRDDGVTANDAGDGDAGPNDLLNFPALTSAIASAGSLTVAGSFNVPPGTYRIEFFRNAAGADPSGFGEGQTFVNSLNLTSPGGTLVFSRTFPGSVGDVITATATACTDGAVCAAFGSTSEFSNAITAITTAVRLVSFTAAPADRAVDLQWRTGSEINNLGFHLYRAPAEAGPYTRITAALVPGLGSSPIGASYEYRDAALENGVRYFYKLEDVETTGRTELHGPVSAAPAAAEEQAEPADEEGAGPGAGEKQRSAKLTAYGDPTAVSLHVLEHDSRHAVVELRTGGFYASHNEDGSMEIQVPSFEDLAPPGMPQVPTRRAWVEAVAGRGVRITSVRALDVVRFFARRPSAAAAPAMEVTRQGIVRPARARRPANQSFRGAVYPEQWAALRGTAFQLDTKKAELELAPLRYHLPTGRLVLARRLRVRVEFVGREAGESSLGGFDGRRRPGGSGPESSASPFVQLVVRERGLYRVAFEDVFPGGRLALSPARLRLTRLGTPVAFSVDQPTFGPGAALYFLSEGAALNPASNEIVYELARDASGVRMAEVGAAPDGPAASFYLRRLKLEENRMYQPGLLDAPDLWLWQSVPSRLTRAFSFAVDKLVPSAGPGRLRVWLQGMSDFVADPDHHVRVSLNGVPVAEASWDGQKPRTIEVAIPPAVLVEGSNTLHVENVGDTEATSSVVALDRFEVDYPRAPTPSGGVLEGSLTLAGTLQVAGLGADAILLDTTEPAPRVLRGAVAGPGQVAFRVEAGRRYLAAAPSAVRTPERRFPARGSLRARSNQADYLMVGPRELLPAGEPLLALREGQGLRTMAVAVEDVYDAFGFGEVSPEAIKAFLSYAHHSWRRPSPRYVVLLGDATYDPKNFLRTGARSHVPPTILKTAYLWTASDPAYAAVNGEDLLPDVALGRLPAATLDEARVLVEKIVAFEASQEGLSGRAVLVADNPDPAGDFERDAEEIASGVLAAWPVTKLYLSQKGASMRPEIASAFDAGASLVSYIGHGGTSVWASENVWNNWDVPGLARQPKQPVLFTLSCLNGYFHHPVLDSLTEALLKAEGKGVVAAVSPSGLSLDLPAHLLHQALLAEVVSGRHERLGDAFLAAQVRYADSGSFPELLAIYNLFGDPALRIR